jgi:hypothetical protein
MLATGVAGCGLFTKATGALTSPSPVGPPTANAAIGYTAVGASDANVGSTAVCAPFGNRSQMAVVPPL